jgi:hypothetical protein
MHRRFRLVWLLPFAVPLLVPCLILFLLWDQYRPQPAIPDAPHREILSSDPNLSAIARLDVCIAGAVQDRYLLALDHRLVYLYSDGTPRGPFLRLQDVRETVPSWQSEGTQYPISMAVRDDTLFLTSSLEAQAYDLDTGELLWQSQVLPGHTGNVIVPDQLPGLTIYYTAYNPVQRSAVILTLDPQTGSVIQRADYPLDEPASMIPYSASGFLWLGADGIWLSPNSADPPTWRFHTRGQVARWPLQYGNTLVVSSGFFPQMSVVRLDTGELVWEDLREFVSLPVVYRGLIFALTRGAELVALDPESGHQVRSVTFTALTPEEGSRSYLYTLAATEEIIAVYFGDSCEVFIFASPAA